MTSKVSSEGKVQAIYTCHTLFDGYPAASSHHGALGWSSVVVLTSADKVVVVDTGPPAYGSLIHERLAAIGLKADDVTDILLTHSHWDHDANLTLFEKATIRLSRTELEWSKQSHDGDYHRLVSPLVLTEEAGRVATFDWEEGIISDLGIQIVPTPGHTPGHTGYRVSTVSGRMVIAGDACKNRLELETGQATLTLDDAESRSSLALLRHLAVKGATIVPGHDAPLKVDDSGVVRAAEDISAEAIVHSVNF